MHCDCCRASGGSAYVTGQGRYQARLCATCATGRHALDRCRVCALTGDLAQVWHCQRLAHCLEAHPTYVAKGVNMPEPEPLTPAPLLTKLGTLRFDRHGRIPGKG